MARGRLQRSPGDSILASAYNGQGNFEPTITFRVESRSERRVRERVILIGLLFAVLLFVGCGGPSAESGPTDKCELDNPPLFEKGQLTVATDKPAYPPWFKGSSKHYSGYEGDIASEIADRMDLPIKWTVEPFNKSYAPGAKDFDFDINEITITPERERAVDFSDGYFNNAQGVLVMKGNPAAKAKSVSDLKDLTIGAQVGTTALDFVNEPVKPNTDPKVYDTT